MTTADELLDIVDDHDRVIGRERRADIHTRRLNHRAVHVLVFNSRGDLFIQKRAATKDTHPGCYDSSASGHVDSGEDYDVCAVRELREELGLDIPRERLRRLFKLAASERTDWEFIWVYSLHGDYLPVINADEIASGEFWPQSRIEQLIQDQPNQFAPAFACVFDEVHRRKLLPGQS